jgi:hypothetical protein
MDREHRHWNLRNQSLYGILAGRRYFGREEVFWPGGGILAGRRYFGREEVFWPGGGILTGRKAICIQ